VNHPDHVRQVLEERPRNYDKRTRSVAKMRATCGSSLLTEDGPVWLRHRRLVQPALMRQELERFLPMVTTATAVMFEHWSAAAREARPLDIAAEMLQLTLTIAARMLFGADVSDDTEAIEQSLTEILADTWRRVESIIDLTAVAPMFHRRRFVNAVRQIDAVVYRLIEKRRRATQVPDDLLTTLLQASDPHEGRGLTDNELRDATITMLLAGHETTANALTSTLALIFRSPEVEKKLVIEVQGTGHFRIKSHEDFEHLSYAGMVFAEAIRLHPSIWIMERRVIKQDEIGGYLIPARSMLLISPWLLHRHPQYWHDAEHFDPERFSAARLADRPKHAYIPFGAGPHQCIGRFMAPMLARRIITDVVRRFRLVPAWTQMPVMLPGITLRHGGPVLMVPVERYADRGGASPET
jgi:cytochrome P450